VAVEGVVEDAFRVPLDGEEAGPGRVTASPMVLSATQVRMSIVDWIVYVALGPK